MVYGHINEIVDMEIRWYFGFIVGCLKAGSICTINKIILLIDLFAILDEGMLGGNVCVGLFTTSILSISH
jgi:hypothetical protein